MIEKSGFLPCKNTIQCECFPPHYRQTRSSAIGQCKFTLFSWRDSYLPACADVRAISTAPMVHLLLTPVGSFGTSKGHYCREAIWFTHARASRRHQKYCAYERVSVWWQVAMHVTDLLDKETKDLPNDIRGD